MSAQQLNDLRARVLLTMEMSRPMRADIMDLLVELVGKLYGLIWVEDLIQLYAAGPLRASELAADYFDGAPVRQGPAVAFAVAPRNLLAAILPAIGGALSPITLAPRKEMVLRLERAGFTPTEIAELVGSSSPRSVSSLASQARRHLEEQQQLEDELLERG
jgi:hypothetical protein